MFTRPRRITRGAAAATIAALLASPLLAVPASAAEAPPEPGANPEVRGTAAQQPTDRFIVKFQDQGQASSRTRGNAYGVKARELGISVKELKVMGTGATVVETSRELEAGEAEAFVESLEATTAVEYAEPDQILQVTSLSPQDEFYHYQWPIFGENGIDANAAWDTTTGDGITVAVVDTGITRHADLDANVLPGYDMIGDPAEGRDGDGRDPDASDEGDYGESGECGTAPSSWHGTHVAGTIAAAANDQGVVGIAPGAKILPVRALAECGGWMSDIMDGVIWASGGAVPGVPANPNPAQVVNLSVGGSGGCTTSWQSAINGALGRGSIVVAAAGNDNENAAFVSPANCEHVIAVAASGRDGGLAPYSNYGDIVDVVAPGGNMDIDPLGGILSTINMGSSGPVEDFTGQDYAFYQGTSMAAPHVSATAALMLSANRTLTPATVEDILKGTTRPLPIPCGGGCGTGLIDARAAVDAAVAGGLPTPPGPGTVIVPGSVAITGNPRVGQALTAHPGTWSPAPETLTYQWLRNGEPITVDGTGKVYVLESADHDKRISVVVTGTRTGSASVSAASAQTGPIAPGELTGSTPLIRGAASYGQTLTVDAGIWTTGTAFEYRWFRDDGLLADKTGPTYAITLEDIGHRISVQAIGTKPGYDGLTKVSAQTAAVTAGSLTAPVPTVSGTTKVGYTLTANTGAWTTGTTLKYQWYRSGVPITGATGATFALTAADLGRSVSVGVTGSKPGYTTVLKYSAWSGTVVAGSLATAKPTVTGTTKVGYTLTANTGTWTSGTTFKYQWFRTGVPITGATGKTYALTAADLGKNISVGVTGSKAGYSNATVYSVRTVAVAAGTLTASKPTVSGTTRLNYTLTANTGTWTTGTTFTYQWFRTGVAITGATAKTYKLTTADLGKTMSVGVTGSKAGYNKVLSYSVRTVAVTR
ncbi:S8 family serine peptidase [Arthrobacter burdickii]|uniref:S8 family serine peptidase n=1 Tax=Arthrobacter burdickii TaxID=3035920 RepID=A0ABT8K534_9MICC|nr:S8 family serine peptidase [Arthrobacter burdickii]MDN4611911.1 S8 family serine peptidase [Arthrobacter burdickii]